MKDYLEVLASNRLNTIKPLYVKKETRIMPTIIDIMAPNSVLKESYPS